jgi:RHS repeat-associated protein
VRARFKALAVTVLVTVCSSFAIPATRAADAPVGTIEGGFAVDAQGSASYTVPIVVPPGIADVAPALSFTYNSRRANGYLGAGWELTGVSAITRCGASYHIDGFKAGVDFGTRDRFCIDGQRLIALNGHDGDDGTVYHTERESWTQVVSHGRCGAGPCTFTARNKDGTSTSFGATTGTTGSRIEAEGRADVRTWAIDAFTDRNGNAVGVTYHNEKTTGEYYPVRIAYGGNARARAQSDRAVSFSYEDRGDRIERFFGGARATVSKRLARIDTEIGGTRVLSYRLAYQPASEGVRSLLQSLTLCDAGDACRPATTFAWQKREPGFAQVTQKLPGPLYARVGSATYPIGMLQDIDGDGILDYVAAVRFADGREDLRVFLGRPDGSFVRAPSYDLPGPVWCAGAKGVSQCGLLADLNGDGILDYVRGTSIPGRTDELDVWLGGPHGFRRAEGYRLPKPMFVFTGGRFEKTAVLTDLDGDGIPDFVRGTRIGGVDDLTIEKGTGHGFTPTGKRLPGPLFVSTARGMVRAGILEDIDGDGIPDYSAGGLNGDLAVYRGSATLAFTRAFSLPGPLLVQINGDVLDAGILTDVNGDGIPEYSRASQIADKRYLAIDAGTGAGFRPVAWTLPAPLLYFYRTSTASHAEVQGLLTTPGIDDRAQFSRATRVGTAPADLELFAASANGFFRSGERLPGPLFQVVDGATLGVAVYEDVAGTGLPSYVESLCVLKNGIAFENCNLGIHRAMGPFPDLLTTITNGLGGTTTIAYAPLSSDPALYRRGDAPAAYPLRATLPSTYVVSRYVTADGRGHSYRFHMAYEGGRVDVRGPGFLGFARVASTEDATGRRHETDYRLDVPFNGLPSRETVSDRTGKLLSRDDTVYADVADATRRSKQIHQIVPVSTAHTAYQDGAVAFVTNAEAGYDGYGNRTFDAQLGTNPATVAAVFICTRYRNDEQRWLLGFVEQVKVVRTKAGCAAFLAAAGDRIVWDSPSDLRWTTVAYDERMNVRREAAYDDAAHAFVATTSEVDEYGNVIRATSPAGAVTTYRYDERFHTFPAETISPQLQRGTQAYALHETFDYDPRFGVLRASKDPSGVVTEYAIDGFGRTTAMRGPDPSGKLVTIAVTTWVRAGGAVVVEERERPEWSSSDDVRNWRWSRTYLDGLERAFRNEGEAVRDGVPATVMSEREFDGAGRVARASQPHFALDPAPFTTTTYDDLDRPLNTTAPDGVIQKHDYSEGGLRVLTTEAYGTPEATTTAATFDVLGRAAEALQPNGLRIRYEYDPIGQLLATRSSPEERSQEQAYDSLGRARVQRSADSGTATWTYDAAGRLTAITAGTVTTIAFAGYDALGRPRTRTSTGTAGTTTTTFTYDDPEVRNALGRVSGVAINGYPGGPRAYQFGYDAYGNLIAGTQTFGANRYVYGSTYDPADQLASYTYPDGSTLRYRYRRDGMLQDVALAAPGADAKPIATVGDYTALGQVQTLTYDGPQIRTTREYYPLGPSYGQLKTIASASVSAGRVMLQRALDWSKLGNVEAVRDAKQTASQSFDYRNEGPNGRMSFLHRARGPYGSIAYDYDRLGSLRAAGDVRFESAPGTDRLTRSSNGETFGYDSAGAMNARASSAASWRYAYDGDGNLVTATRAASGRNSSAVQGFGLDGERDFTKTLDASVTTSWIDSAFEIVERGGRKQFTKYVSGPLGPMAAITANGDPLANAAAGAVRERLLATLYGGNARGRALALAHALTADADALRDAAVAHPARLGSLAAAAVALAAALAGVGLRRRRLRWRRGVVVAGAILLLFSTTSAAFGAELQGDGIPVPGVRYFVQDHLGSTALVTDGAGNETAAIAYLPYGEIDRAHSSGIDDFRPKFAGHEWSRETGLYAFGVRQYDPKLGRFLQPDPAQQFLAAYGYAAGNPTSVEDPTGGAAAAIAVAIVVGAIIGAYVGAAAFNEDFNPLNWDWSHSKTYAGLIFGAVIGAVGAAAGGIVAEAGIAVGSLGGAAAQAAGIAIGIGGQAAVGAAENVAFTALAGGTDEELAQSALEGALLGAAFGALGAAADVAGMAARRAGGTAAGDGAGAVARREAGTFGGCSSFPAGTAVLSATGQAFPIERIAVGNRVASSDGDRRVAGTVTELRRHFSHELVRVVLRDGTAIEATADHPFRLYRRGWLRADALAGGDALVDDRDRPVFVARVEREATSSERAVYNFVVVPAHDYYVSPAHVLVHNPAKDKKVICTAVYLNKGPDLKTVKLKFSRSKLKSVAKNDNGQYNDLMAQIEENTRIANESIGALEQQGGSASTATATPVDTASMQWVVQHYADLRNSGKIGKIYPNKKSIVKSLAKIYPNRVGPIQVQEPLGRNNGGLTIREGFAQNHMAMTGRLNTAIGGAMGRLAKNPRVIAHIVHEYVP